MHPLIYLVLSLVLSLLVSCTGSKMEKSAESYAMKEASYYDKLPKNIDRLCALQEGFFVLRAHWPSKDSIAIHLTETGDSLLSYSAPLGEPNRDGHWMLLIQFTSSLPDEPLVYLFQRIRRINRDTFLGEIYAAPKELAFLDFYEAGPSYMDEIDLKQLADTGTVYYSYSYTKHQNSHFECFTEIFPTFLEYNKDYAYRQDVSNYKPAGVYMSTHFFDAAKQLAPAENRGNPSNFFERLPPAALKAYVTGLK